LNGTNQFLAYADHHILLGEDIITTKESKDGLLLASNQVFLVVCAEKTKYMFMSCHLVTGKSHNIKVANKFFKNVVNFKHLGTAVRNHNCIHEVTASGINVGNACW
jgi:hypothetical protein